MKRIDGEQAAPPELQKHAGLRPLHEPTVRRGLLADAGRVERRPLAARAQDEEDRLHCLSRIDLRVVAAQRVPLASRQERLHARPEFVGEDPVVVFGGEFHHLAT